MLTGKTIALFIDVDNCGMQKEHYDNVIEQVAKMGEIVIGKVYGATERKHKQIIVDATNSGYTICLPMRVKKRNSKVFDNRIMCDVVEAILTNNKIDAVAVACGGGDLVYFYRLLKKYGVKVIACDNADDETNALIDEVIDTGIVEKIKLPRPQPKSPAPVAKAPQPVVEEVAPSVAKEKEPVIAEVEEILKVINQQPEKQEQPVVEETVAYQPQDDGDIIKKIEQIRNKPEQEEDELVAQIKKLLDEMKD